MARLNLKRINRVLSLAVALLGVYLVLTPLLPSIGRLVQQWSDPSNGYRYASRLASVEAPDLELPEPPEGNRLLIPKIDVDTRILEGATADTLNQGVWHRPATGSPATGGNTVLTGHRFLYTAGPNTFYFLNELAVGDTLAVFWDDVEYDYEVTSVEVVPPTAVEVEAPTDQPILTLYTCTPIWTATDRLVVRAKPMPLPV